MTLASPTVLPQAQMPALFDVVIVGGGMVGATLAAALGNSHWRVALIEGRNPLLGADGRASALALGTVHLLQDIGVWQGIEAAAPIRQIKVSDGDWSYDVTLDHNDIEVEALGYVVPNQSTLKALYRYLETCKNITLLTETTVATVEASPTRVRLSTATGDIQAQLLIAADGARSPLRQQMQIPYVRWGYGQCCVVTTVTTAAPHTNVAYERFQPSGPFAILPQADPQQSCVVWTVRERDRDRLLALNDADFIAALQPSFGSQLGAITAVTPRACYTPYRLHCDRYRRDRVVLVGDAAHTTHPLGGQGVNLGMRDVAALAALMRATTPDRVDWPRLLQRYQRLRQSDNRRVLWATDIANRLFSNRIWPLLLLRRASFAILNAIAPLRRLIMRYAMGLHCRY